MSDSGSLFGDVHKPSARAIYEQRKKYSSFIVADVSQYAVNHLVTFSIGEEDDLTCMEDAIRKLCIMDKQGKIWVQEMLLQVSGSAIKLLDINSKEELENYPLATVAYCDAVCPESRSRSLLVLMCQEPTQLRPDIHFFECDQIRAEWIQQDISSALLDFNTGGNTQRTEALRAAQNMLDNQEISQPPTQAPSRSRTKIVAPGPREDAILVGEPDLAFIQIEQNVELLNHVFDDVEAFVKKLQKSAEAFRVLNQSRRSARGRLREPGEGLLTIRAKPPSQEEFEDTLSKIKYSFSLLARLKSNITSPTSEELLCILFKPLKMIVDASGGVEFASELRNPMITLEAVTLMRSCLGEQETELWHSLGENWTKPRVDFPRGYAAPYNLTFCSDWELPVRDAFGKPWEDPVEIQHRHEERRTQQSAPTIAANGCKHPEKPVICTHSFTARNSNELSVLQGEILEVLDDSKKWWKVKNYYGQVGYVPYNILAPVLNGDNSSIQNGKEMLLIHEITPVMTKITPPQPPAKTTNLQSNGVKWATTEELNKNHSKKEHFSVVNEELILKLANGTGGCGKALHIPRTLDTDVPLDYNSNSDQVRTWLEAKGFNPLIVNALGILNGAQLLSLQKDEFRAISPEEGPRVYSQVTIQKALLKDSGKMSELEAVMARQKIKAEGLD
ncbi:epidermal growth factor receptor kinase substrate 8-like protein 1 [Vipera latastei]